MLSSQVIPQSPTPLFPFITVLPSTTYPFQVLSATGNFKSNILLEAFPPLGFLLDSSLNTPYYPAFPFFPSYSPPILPLFCLCAYPLPSLSRPKMGAPARFNGSPLWRKLTIVRFLIYSTQEMTTLQRCRHYRKNSFTDAPGTLLALFINTTTIYALSR